LRYAPLRTSLSHLTSTSCSRFCLVSILSDWFPSLPSPLGKPETDHVFTHSSRLPGRWCDECRRIYHKRSIWFPDLFSFLLSLNRPLNSHPTLTFQVANACGRIAVYCSWALILYSPLRFCAQPSLANHPTHAVSCPSSTHTALVSRHRSTPTQTNVVGLSSSIQQHRNISCLSSAPKRKETAVTGMIAELGRNKDVLEGGNRSHYGPQETRQEDGREGGGES
jgi:hypothetical protein